MACLYDYCRYNIMVNPITERSFIEQWQRLKRNGKNSSRLVIAMFHLGRLPNTFTTLKAPDLTFTRQKPQKGSTFHKLEMSFMKSFSRSSNQRRRKRLVFPLLSLMIEANRRRLKVAAVSF